MNSETNLQITRKNQKKSPAFTQTSLGKSGECYNMNRFNLIITVIYIYCVNEPYFFPIYLLLTFPLPVDFDCILITVNEFAGA
jgi:hypothetical protein